MPLTTYTAGQVLTAASLNANFTFAAANGKIAQVVSTAKTDTFSTTSTSFVDITGLSVSITPSSATSKILVLATFKTAVSGDIAFFHRLIRGSTAICIGDTAGSRTPTTTANIPGSTGNIDVVTQAINFLDSPATTSATTYKIDCRVSSGTGYLNRTGFDTDSASVPRTASTITVMEILA